MAWKKSNTTPHSSDCTMAFGRLSAPGCCPRCEELRNGAKPVPAWNAKQLQLDAMRREAMRKHFAPGGPADQMKARGEVDTAFEW
jgi:hypothetical protein